MSTSAIDVARPRAVAIRVDDSVLSVDLADGRTVSAPIGWYPRLSHATPAERGQWRLTGDGDGVHWPALEEDLSVESIVAGRPSAESASSLARWLAARS